MADETTIIEYIEEQDRSPSDCLTRNASTFSNPEVTPDDSWFELDITERLKSALKSGFMLDLNVRLLDGQIRCHSNILAISSPKLAGMLRKNQHEIKLSGVKTNIFKTLLRIIYSKEADELKTDVEKTLDVAKVAHDLKIHAAVTYCIKLLKKLVDATNVCSMLDLASLLDQLELKEACAKVTRELTYEVLKSDGFLKCDVATLEHILKQDVVHNVKELGLFQATVLWAKTHTNPREALGSCLSLIRFRTFTTEDIATYVKPAKLLTDKEEQELLWYLLSKGKGEMPAAFSNEINKRHTTWSVEHFSANTKEIYLSWSVDKYVTKEELNATPPLRISVNEDAFLIGVKPWSFCEGKTRVDKYMEDVEVTLKDDKGTLISTATFRVVVQYASHYYVKFPHAVELRADVTYQLHFSHNVSGVRHWTGKCKKQERNGKNSLKINVLEEEFSPISRLIIAPKSV